MNEKTQISHTVRQSVSMVVVAFAAIAGMGTLNEANALSVNFDREIGKIRPELHSSGFGPQICACPQENIDAIKAMGFKASRTHDWSLINPGQRVCDYYFMFPLMHLDAKDPKNYLFSRTDYLLNLTREKLGHEIFFRLGASIEHSDMDAHFNVLIPEDFEKVAEIFAATVRHYNNGWGNGHNWGIKYWEIWGEPDNRNLWDLRDDQKAKIEPSARDQKRMEFFVKFFVMCLKRLKSEFPDIKVGGPALVKMREYYFIELLKACKEAGVAPDFISWHHYTGDPKVIMDAIDKGRELCDSFGFRDCELIIDEWHYFGPYAWRDLFPWKKNASLHSEGWKRAISGPASHTGIDSSCFNITMLSKFQTSKLDQAYYYGCRNEGNWGFMDSTRRKNKVFYGLKMFGGFIKERSLICESSGSTNVTVFAAKDAAGNRKAMLVTDYRSSSADEISVEVSGVPANADVRAWVHDYTRDFEPISVRFEEGKVFLKKADVNSAAYLVTF